MGAALDKDSEQEFNYLVPPSIIQPLHRASENALTLKELDDLERDTGPTLRTFLTAVNMERLEYRLKLIGECIGVLKPCRLALCMDHLPLPLCCTAGIFTLFELSNHTTEQLVSKGFTELMARRLQRAFDDYVMNLPDDLEESAVQKTPFHVVRPNAVLPTTASTLMRKMINYGRKGVKRTSGVSQAQHVPTVIRLPTKSTLPTSLLTQPDEIGTPAEEGDQTDGIAHSPSAVLIRTQSVPTNLHHDKLSLWSFEHQACISAPCLLMSELRTRNNTSLAEIVSKMEKEEEESTDAILCYLYCLLDVLCVQGRKEEEVKMVERLLSVICHVFERLGQCDEVIVIVSRLLSCLTEFGM